MSEQNQIKLGMIITFLLGIVTGLFIVGIQDILNR